MSNKDMKDITLTLDRSAHTNKASSRKAMQEIVKELRPFVQRGLRVRVALSKKRLSQDDIWN
jgi:hypothetical protein